MTSSIHLARNALLWAPHGPERPGNAGTGRSSMPAERLQSLGSRRDRLGGLGADHAHHRVAATELHQGVQLGSIHPVGMTSIAAAWALQDVQIDPRRSGHVAATCAHREHRSLHM